MHPKFVIPVPTYVAPDGAHGAIVSLINEINSRLPYFTTHKELETLMLTRAELNDAVASLKAIVDTAVVDITAAVTALESSSDFTPEVANISAISTTITEGLAKLAAALPSHPKA